MENDKPQDAEVIPPVEGPSQLPATQPKTNAVVRLGAGVLFASVAEVWALADNLRKGGAGPKGATTASIAASIIKGQSLGLDCVTAMSFVTVVNGRASLMGDLALGLIRKSGLVNPKLGGYLREEWTGEGEGRTCTMSAKRHDTGEEMVRSFSVAQARVAGLIGKTAIWTGFQDRMLRYRALGFLLRDLFSDILLGLYLTEELQDGSSFTAPPEAPVVEAQSAQAVADAPDPFFAAAAPEPKALVASTVPEGLIVSPEATAVLVEAAREKTPNAQEPARAPQTAAPTPEATPDPPDSVAGQPLTEAGLPGNSSAISEAEEPEPTSQLDEAATKLLASAQKFAEEKDPFEGFRDSPAVPERIEVKPSAKKAKKPASYVPRPVKASPPPDVSGATGAVVNIGSSTVAIIRNPNAATGKKPGRLF